MSRTDALLAVALLIAAGSVTYGVWLIEVSAGFIAGGILLAAVAALFLLDIPDDSDESGHGQVERKSRSGS